MTLKEKAKIGGYVAMTAYFLIALWGNGIDRGEQSMMRKLFLREFTEVAPGNSAPRSLTCYN